VQFIKVEKIRIDASKEIPQTSFAVLLNNPNAFGLKLRSAEAKFQILGKSLGKAKLDQSFYISAGKENSIPFVLNFDKDDLNNLASSALGILLGTTSNNLNVRGFIKVRKFLWYKKLEFDLNQKIDMDLIRSLKI
jgi:hypothetical protein